MNRETRWNAGILVASVALLALAVAPSAAARDMLDGGDDGIEITRDAAELPNELRPRPPEDADVADTALVFTNEGGSAARVRCAGFNKNGYAVGRAWVAIPARGLRYVLASDLSRGRDFVGQVQCSAPVQVKGSAVFLGPDLTDLPAFQVRGNFGRLRFPVVATY